MLSLNVLLIDGVRQNLQELSTTGNRFTFINNLHVQIVAYQ